MVLAGGMCQETFFQTPRVWGGCNPTGSKVDHRHFRPHACGVDVNDRAVTTAAVVSDPTRVGWILDLVVRIL